MVQFMNETADAYAQIRGDAGHSKIKGNIYFFEMYGEHWLWQKWKVFQMQKMLQTQISTDSIFMKEHYVQEMKRIHLLRQRDIIIRKIQYIQGMRGIFLHCLQMRGLHGAPFTQTGFTRKK